MLELKQPCYDHLVIQSEKFHFFLTRKVSWVNKWSKRECFEDKPRSGRPSVDQYCSKINGESEVQTEQFNKEDCQESSPENYWSFEHNGGDTWPGKDGRHSSERKYLCWAKSKVKPVWDSPRNTRSWQQRIGTTFYLQTSALNIFSSVLIQKRYRLGPAGMCCYLQLGNGVGWHYGSLADKLTHDVTHRPNLNF